MEDVKPASPSPEAVGDDVKAQEQGTAPVDTEQDTAQPGSKTDSALLLKALHEERERRRIAELRAEQAEEHNSVQASTDDEDDRIARMDKELRELKTKQARQEVLEANPILKEHLAAFDAFRDDPENKGMNLKTAAKAFLTEKGLLEPRRPGLEKPTSGRAPVSPGMTADQVADLRKNNYRKYQDMVLKGQLKISE